jgi:PadR family transcriptional regulator, regulatory protein PadR
MTIHALKDRHENAKFLDIMGDGVRLGEVEQLVLLAVLRLDGAAYAVPIRDLILREAEVDLPRGSIYVTLDRLEEKGLVESWFGDPVAEPGGKARRLFRTTPAGLATLTATRRALDRLATGTVVARTRS